MSCVSKFKVKQDAASYPRAQKPPDTRLKTRGLAHSKLHLGPTFILTQACKEFEQRVGQVKSPPGAKTELVEHAIEIITGEFGITDLDRACPGVSRDMIRRVLRDLKAEGRVECLGRGPGAKWRRKGITP